MKRLAAKFSSQVVLVVSAALLLSTAAFAQDPSSDSAPPPAQGHGAMRGPGFGPGPFRDRMELLGIGGVHRKVVHAAPVSPASHAPTKQALSHGETISGTAY